MKNLEKRKRNLKLLDSLSDDTLHMLERFNKCNKQAKRFILDLVKTDPFFWDYGFLLDMEYAYLKEMRETLLKEDLFMGVKRECERIQTCLNLLDIIQSRKSAIHLKFSKFPKHLEDFKASDSHWEIKKYVNTKNYKRFIHENAFKNMDENNGKILVVDMLHEVKAWRLYHKMREYWMKGWWS